MKNRTKVVAIARKVREELETHAKNNDFPNCLKELCAIASGRLLDELQRCGVLCEIGISLRDEPTTQYREFPLQESHCFVIVDDHVVDITATQFDINSKVTIVPMKQAVHYWFWRPSLTVRNSAELIMHQRANRWPDAQLARKWA